MLPVVPKDGGQYTLRLGNSLVGAESDLVVLRFTVTADMPFFQLRYAVVLNDPHHHEFEQPRFELRILDEKNTIIPCGEYKVKAAPEIPEFESCGGGWRVRPWTTVGFDLQPYIGQTLQIEFLTTDCAQGGHAGYAYLEASCNPFKMEVLDYCPTEAKTIACISEGYVNYLWNTGDTTTTIDIPNPQNNTEYSVTVTSNTGCSFVMKDTLNFSVPPEFLPERDRTFCRDTQWLFTPRGHHLDSIFSPTIGISSDTFLIKNDDRNYTFIATNLNSCYSDTLDFSLAKAPLSITTTEDTLRCFGDRDGAIQITATTDFPPFQYQWSNGASTSTLTNLSAGLYTVTISDAIHCSTTQTLKVFTPASLQLNAIEMRPITCNGMNNGSLSINPEGGVKPYQVNWNALSRNTMQLDSLEAGNYSVTVTDANGCWVQDSMLIIEPSPIVIDTWTTDIDCFGGKDGEIGLTIEGGILPYHITWEDNDQITSFYRNQMSAGEYRAFIEDEVGCQKEVTMSIKQPPFSENCGTYIPNVFSPNDDGVNDDFYVLGSLAGKVMKTMKIFDRWGELVFENTGYCTEIGNASCGWSGHINHRPAPVGVYVYLIIIEIENQASPIMYTGDVTLIR